MTKARSRMDIKRAAYSAALMNDTKWREVFAILATRSCAFSIATISDECFGVTNTLRVPAIYCDHLGDVLTSGPVHYRDIFALRILRLESVRNALTGVLAADESLGLAVLGCLNRLGALPIEISLEHITIHAYRKL